MEKPITEAERLARAYLVALQAKDKQGILDIITDDFELQVPFNCSGTNDGSDNWIGIEKARENYATTFKKIAVLVYTDLEYSAGADPSIAFAEGRGVMKMATGRAYGNSYIFRFDTVGGKIKRIREWANPVTAAVSFGLPLPIVEPV